MKRSVFCLAALSIAGAALAQHGPAAHQHGLARLTVAIDGERVEVEFASPLDGLTGFEHAPRNAGQRAALAAAAARLGDFGSLFVLPPAAQCRLVGHELDLPWHGGSAVPGGDPHGSHADDGHADATVVYRLHCAQPAALDRLQLKLAAAFPRLHRIDAERASPRGQVALRLRADDVLPL